MVGRGTKTNKQTRTSIDKVESIHSSGHRKMDIFAVRIVFLGMNDVTNIFLEFLRHTNTQKNLYWDSMFKVNLVIFFTMVFYWYANRTSN